MKKTYGYWNYDRCYEEAKKYSTRTDFRNGNNSAYRKSLKHNWLKDYSWFVTKQKPSGYWDYEHCYEEAKKYNTINDFQKNSNGAYDSARRNKWMDEYTWMTDGRIKLFTNKIDCVYKYYFEQTHSIYVGRTVHKQKRDKQHIFDYRSDTVAKYAYENGFNVPEMVIIEDNLTIEQGQKREDFWLNFYKENGYNILNRKRAGSIGAICFGKWTKEKCLKEALKYRTKNEFQKGCGRAYQAAYKHGWMEDFIHFENGHINHKNISKPVLQYTLDGHFIKEYPSAKEAERQTGTNCSNIRSCCKGNSKYSHAGGFIWKYAS